MLRKTILAFAALVAMTGCGGAGGEEGDKQSSCLSGDSASLRIAVMPTIDCIPIYVAYHSGIFQRESLSVSLIPFTAHMDCDTAIAGGSVHVVPTDLVRGERLIRQGTDLNYVTSTELQWQLLASKSARIKKLPQMDDKMVAMTRFSATAMLADHLVDSTKIATERVFRIQVNDVLVRLSMMETGIMDAALMPEPQATAARLLGSNVLYDSGSDSLRLGALAFSKKALADTLRREQMETFVRAYDAACDSLNTYGIGHYAEIIARECHVAEAVVDSMEKQHPTVFCHAQPPRQTDIDRAKAWTGK